MIEQLLTSELENLLEKIEAVAENEGNLFSQIAGSSPLIIYGAGQLGRKVLSGLRQIGIEPLAFLDRKADSQGKMIDGIPMYHPEKGPAGFPLDTTVVIAVWCPGGNARHAVVTEGLCKYGFSRIVSFMPLFWANPEIFLPHFRLDLPSKAISCQAKIRRVFSLLADEGSRQCFMEQLNWQLLPEAIALVEHSLEYRYNEHDIYVARNDELFVDCGAYTGDTLEMFLRQRGDGFSHVLALEPDPQNFDRLISFVAELPATQQSKITCLPFASSRSREKIRFSSGLELSSRIDNATGNIEVDGISLDELCKGLDISYIKMDIEGAEPEAIQGARETIIRCSPIVAACVYHQQDHLWQIAMQLHEINPEYHFFLRRYGDEYGDVVLYAVPTGRLAH